MYPRASPFRRPVRFVAVLFLACTAIPAAHAASATWGINTSGSWSSVSNWSPTSAPGSTTVLTNTDVATFSSGPGGTITIDSASQNIGNLLFGGNAGAYTIGSSGANAGNSLLLTSSGTINVTTTNANNQTVNSPLVLEPTTNVPPGTYTIQNNNTSTGALIVNGNISGGTTSQGIILALQGTSISANNLISGVIADGGATGKVAVIKTGAGTWALTGANSYTGTTTIDAGTLNLGGGTAAGSLASTVLQLSGGTLSYTRTDGATQAFTTTNLVAGGVSAISVVSGNSVNLGTIVNTGGTMDFGSTGAGMVGALTASNTNGIVSGTTYNGSTWAVANGAGSAFTGLASYTSSTTAGTAAANYASNNLDVDNSAGLLSGVITANSLRFNTATANTVTLVPGSNVLGSSGILVTSAVGNNLSTITGGNLTGASNTALVVIQNNTGNGLTIGSNIVNNSVTGLSKFGAGSLTLTGINTYTGNITVTGGTLTAGSSTALGSNNLASVGAGATLDLSGFNKTIIGLSSATASGTITSSSSAALRFTTAMGVSSTASSAAQLFTGNLSLQFYGGTQGNTILTNTASTYSGGTILGNGSGTVNTRVLLGGGTLGAGSPGAVTSGLFGTGAVTIGAVITDRSQLYFSGGITVNNAIVVNSSIGTDFAGSFRVESTGVVLAGTINANLDNAMFSTNNNSGRTATVTGAISGNSGLIVSTQSSAGLTVTLSNAGTANSYAGNTTIATAASALKLGRADQIPNGTGKGNLIVTGGTFNMGGFGETINGLSGAGTVDGLSGTPTLTVGDNNASGTANTFSGVIKNTAGTLALTKIGSGTLTLSGTNTYSGITLISGGTLALTATGNINNTSEVSLGTVGTFDVTAKDLSAYTVSSLKGSGDVLGAISISSQLAIGSSLGTVNFSSSLTLGATSTYVYDLTSGSTPGVNSADLGDVGGALTLTAGSILDLVQLGTYTAGNKFTLFAYDGALSGTFKDTSLHNLADGAAVTDAGGVWIIDYNDTTPGANGGVSASNTYVTITAIPEPNVAALLGGLSALALLRRRR